MTAYYAYAYAWLRYGVVLWFPSTDTHDLFVMQKRCVRILTNTQVPNSCRPHYIQLKLLTLPCIYILEAALFVRKHSELFKTKSQVCNSRNRSKNKLAIPNTKLAMCRKGPFYQCTKITNKLPDHIIQEPNDNKFKTAIKKMLFDKAYYSIDEFLKDRSLF